MRSSSALKVFAKRRARSLYVIRNGKINPEYDTSPGRAVTIASRAVTTLVQYQVEDLTRLYKYAQADDTVYRFCAIPESFDATADGLFDTSYASKLFVAGRKIGSQALWRTTPLYSQELFTP